MVKPGIVVKVTGKSGMVKEYTLPLPKSYETLIKQSEKIVKLVDNFMLAEDDRRRW